MTSRILTYQYDIVFGDEKYKITTRVDTTYGRDYILIYVDGGGEKQGFVLTNDESRIEEFSAWLRDCRVGQIWR